VVLECLQDGRQYVFELNDRLIRDMELDGFTEIPVKLSPGGQQLKPDSEEAGEQADKLEEFVPFTVQGHFCISFILRVVVRKIVLPFVTRVYYFPAYYQIVQFSECGDVMMSCRKFVLLRCSCCLNKITLRNYLHISHSHTLRRVDDL